MTLDEKLEHFYSSVIDSATKQNIEIVEEYKKILQRNFDDRKEVALRKAEANFRIESDNILRERNRRVSAASMEIRRMVLERTAEMSDEVFEEVKLKLLEFMKTDEYEDLLYDLIQDALEFAKGDTIKIYINPSDQDRMSRLEQRTSTTLTLSDRDFIGGIRAVISSHSILIDSSFLTKLEEAKSNFTL
jgi:V/A-type H+/Na+-transporting ATPase subunit E